MEAGEPTGVRDDEHNLARLLHSALKEADACAAYALEAEVAGNEQLAGFFRDVQRTYTSVAGRAEEMLDSRGVKVELRPAFARVACRPREIQATSRRARMSRHRRRSRHDRLPR